MNIPDPSISSIIELKIDSIVSLFPLDQVIMNDTSKITFPGDTIESLNALFSGYKLYQGPNLVEDITYEWMGTSINYQYDEQNHLISKVYSTDVIMKYQVKTEYLPQQNQLKEYWSNKYNELDTTTFQFDPNGILINESGHFHEEGNKRIYSRTFQYNDSLKLIGVITHYQNDSDDLQQTQEVFEYGEGQIKSIAKEYVYGAKRGEWLPEKCYETQFFNHLGLIDSTVIEQGKFRWKLTYLHYKNGVKQAI